MAEHLNHHLYRVSIGSERNYAFIHAKDQEDLIRYLARNHPSRTVLFGVKEVTHDGSLRTVPILDDPLARKLYTENESKPTQNNLPTGITMIDGRPWAVLLPTGGSDPNAPCIWSNAMAAVQNHKARLHQIDIFSWCQETTAPANHRILRGFEPCKWLSSNHNLRHNAIGYRPVLIPLDKETLKVNTSFLLGHPDGANFRFGTLYMDGEAQINPSQPTPEGNIPSYLPDAKLRIGDSTHNPEQRISWLKVGSALIADRNLLKHISWKDVDAQGLALGPDHLRTKEPSLQSILSNARERTAALSPEPQHAKSMQVGR